MSLVSPWREAKAGSQTYGELGAGAGEGVQSAAYRLAPSSWLAQPAFS